MNFLQQLVERLTSEMDVKQTLMYFLGGLMLVCVAVVAVTVAALVSWVFN